MKLKKLMAIILSLLMILTVFVACNKDDDTNGDENTTGSLAVSDTEAEDTKRVIKDDDSYGGDDLFKNTEAVGDMQVGEPSSADRWTPNY